MSTMKTSKRTATKQLDYDWRLLLLPPLRLLLMVTNCFDRFHLSFCFV
jgi:hypothetical protein